MCQYDRCKYAFETNPLQTSDPAPPSSHQDHNSSSYILCIIPSLSFILQHLPPRHQNFDTYVDRLSLDLDERRLDQKICIPPTTIPKPRLLGLAIERVVEFISLVRWRISGVSFLDAPLRARKKLLAIVWSTLLHVLRMLEAEYILSTRNGE